MIFGALNENSLRWQIAKYSYEEGAEIILTNAPFAQRTGETQKLTKEINAKIIPCDVTNLDEIGNL